MSRINNLKRISIGITLSFLIFAFTQNISCDGYLPTIKGKKFTYNQYNNKKQIEGYLVSEVTESKSSGGKVVSKVKQIFKDQNGKETKIGKTEYKCENGTVFLNIKSMIPRQALKSIEGMQGVSIVINADELEIPTSL